MFVSTRGRLQGLRPNRNCGCCGALNTALKATLNIVKERSSSKSIANN